MNTFKHINQPEQTEYSGKYDLIAFDMDGTLLDSRKHFLDSSRAAIREAVNAGKTVCLTTGRCMAELKVPLLEIPEVRYVVGSSGAFIYDNQQCRYIYRHEIAAETVTEIVNTIRPFDLQLVIMSDDSYSQRNKVSHMADYNMGAYQPSYERDFIQPENIISFFLAAPFPAFKLNFYCRSLEDREQLKILLRHLPLDLVHGEVTSLEATLKGVTKGSGFIKLCELLNIAPTSTIAVGDADNDLPVLEAAGLGIAMANANDNVRNAADVTVSDNDSGGCAEAIYRYLMK